MLADLHLVYKSKELCYYMRMSYCDYIKIFINKCSNKIKLNFVFDSLTYFLYRFVSEKLKP